VTRIAAGRQYGANVVLEIVASVVGMEDGNKAHEYQQAGRHADNDSFLPVIFAIGQSEVRVGFNLEYSNLLLHPHR
jgi:hypothetical protein